MTTVDRLLQAAFAACLTTVFALSLTVVAGCSRQADDSAPADSAPVVKPTPTPAKPTVQLLCFWEPWCGPCRAEKPSMIALCKAYGDRVDIVGVSSDSIISAPGVPWRNVLGREAKALYSQYGVMAIPACVLLKNGAEIGRFQGHDETMVAAIEAALK